jgi:RNA polymerase primary sigma factor
MTITHRITHSIPDRPIPHDEFLALARLARVGDGGARDRMIRSNVALVVQIARSYRDRGVDLDDLIGHGILGLIRAVDLFDPDRDVHFSTYGNHWIKQAIRRAIFDHRSTIRVPVGVQDSARRLSGLGKPPTDLDRANSVRVAQAEAVSEIAHWDHLNKCDSVASVTDPGEDPSEQVAERELASIALSLLTRLDPVDRDVLCSYLGIDRPKELLLDISARYGMSPRWAHYIYLRAIDRLRDAFDRVA